MFKIGQDSLFLSATGDFQWRYLILFAYFEIFRKKNANQKALKIFCV